MIKQIKYNRSVGRLLDNLVKCEEFRTIHYITHFKMGNYNDIPIIFVDKSAMKININTWVIRSRFNIEYDCHLHKSILQYLEEYSVYDAYDWGDKLIKV